MRARAVVGGAAALLAAACLTGRAAGAQFGSRPGDAPTAPPLVPPGSFPPGGALVLGAVYDSSAGAPLAGAVVQLLRADAAPGDVSRPITAVADSLGRFRVAGLAPGGWIVGFVHPVMDAYGLDVIPRPVTLSPADSAVVALGIPGPRTMRALLCPVAGARDSSGVVLGTLRSAVDGTPIEGARVALSWSELEIASGVRLVPRRAPVITGPGGTFRFCGVPSDGALAVRAETGADGDTTVTSGLVEVSVGAASLARLDLFAAPRVARADPAPSPNDAVALARRADGDTGTLRALPEEPPRWGPARVTGVVRDPQGRPVAGAWVLLRDAGRDVSSGRNGTFVLDSLPAGSWTLEARALGHPPIRRTVTLVPGQPTVVTLAFAGRVNALERVTVLGRARRDWRAEEILMRRRTGGGYVFLEADIARHVVIQLTDLFRRVPGSRLVQDARGRNVVLVRGGGPGFCVANVFIDGVLAFEGAQDLDWLVPPSQVAAVEVYSATTVPPQYALGRLGAICGAVLVWTKR